MMRWRNKIGIYSFMFVILPVPSNIQAKEVLCVETLRLLV